MWVVLVVVVVVVALGSLAWWSSGRSKRQALDPHRSLIESDAYLRSQETRARFDPGGPFG